MLALDLCKCDQGPLVLVECGLSGHDLTWLWSLWVMASLGTEVIQRSLVTAGWGVGCGWIPLEDYRGNPRV